MDHVAPKISLSLFYVPDVMAFNVRQNSTLLVFLAFDVVVLQSVPTSAIEHSSFQFLYSNCRFDIVCFTIQLCSLKYLIRTNFREALTSRFVKNREIKDSLKLEYAKIKHAKSNTPL